MPSLLDVECQDRETDAADKLDGLVGSTRLQGIRRPREGKTIHEQRDGSLGRGKGADKNLTWASGAIF